MSASGPTKTTNPTTFAPLPVPTVNPALKPIRRQRRPALSDSSGSPAALVPLFHAALLYLAGIVFAHFHYLRPGYLLAGLFPLAIVAVLALWKAPRLTWLPIAAVWVVLGCWSAETERNPSSDPAIARLSDGLLRTVEGTVTDAGPLRNRDADREGLEDHEPEIASEASGEKIQQVDLQLSAAEVVTDSSDSMLPFLSTGDVAGIRLSVLSSPGSIARIRCGQRLRVVIRILPPDVFHDSGVWNRAEYLETKSITATGSVLAAKRDSDGPRLAILDSSGLDSSGLDSGTRSAACLLNETRNAASSRLQTLPALTRRLPGPFRASPEDAAMFTALLTGDRTYLTHTLRVGFERTGSFHLIVVSGLHLAILAAFVLSACHRLRVPRVLATAITLAITLGYALFTGFAIPAQRGFWMIALYLIGRLLYRDRSPLNVIGFATLCLAAVSPRSIFDASLQMTLLSVASIAGIAAPLLERTLNARVKATRDLKLISIDPKLPPRIAQFRVTLRMIARHLEPAISLRIACRFFPWLVRSALQLGELLFVTLVVELALALPIAIYFHRITVYALPVNLCILPLLTILVPSAMLLLLAVSVWPAAAVIVASVCLALLHFSVFLVRMLGSLSLGDLRIPNPITIQIAAAIFLFIVALQLARGARIHRRLSFVALMLAAAAALWPRPIDHAGNALFFEAIDVGQGDSLLLITPDGKTLLVDGGGLGFQVSGNSAKSHTEFDVGEEVVSSVLWSRGIRRLDAVALTHAHHDHMGGLPAILRNFHPRELWVGNNPPVAAYKELLEEASNLGVNIHSFHAGDGFSFGTADFRVLAPTPGYRPGPQPANNDSLVLQGRYGATSILLEGDAEAPEEQTMLNSWAGRGLDGLESTLLKVGHHGSLTSTRPQFLAAVNPRWAVISCGRRNRFGHPRAEILAELQAAHVRTFRTDIDGAACFLLDGKSVSAEPLCGNSGR